MSGLFVYSWGSAAHGGGLGYIVSHSVNEVVVPRPVLSGLDVHSVVTGKTFSALLTTDGEIYVWGVGFGLLPLKTKIPFIISQMAVCYTSGEFILIEKDSDMVYSWIVEDKAQSPVLQQGRIIKATGVSVAGPGHFLIAEKSTNSFIEISTSKTDRLTPACAEILASTARVFADSVSGLCAAEDAMTGEIRVWNAKERIPRKILVRRTKNGGKEWESAGTEFFLKNPRKICNGFAVIGEELVRFETRPTKSDSLVLNGRVIAISLKGEPVRLVDVAVNSKSFFILTVAGDLYQIDLWTMQGEILLEHEQPVLSQVERLESSKHHTVAVVRIFTPRDPPDLSRSELISLKRACALSVMRYKVTVENICEFIESLLCRPMVDFSHFIDLAFSFYRLNRALIRCVNQSGYNTLQKSSQFTQTQLEYERNPGMRFSELLKFVRAERGPDWIEDDILRFETEGNEICEARVEIETRKSKSAPTSPKPPRTNPSTLTPTVAPLRTPVITLHVFEEESSVVPHLDLEEFVPLTDATNCPNKVRSQSSFQKRKVRKWTRKSIENTHAEAPWFTPETVPSSPPLQSVMETEVSISGPKSSRWYMNEPRQRTALSQLMEQEREEREIAEAVRLVEQYEIACALSQQANDSRSKQKAYTNGRHRGPRCKRKQT
jgi:hypothetical protein